MDLPEACTRLEVLIVKMAAIKTEMTEIKTRMMELGDIMDAHKREYDVVVKECPAL